MSATPPLSMDDETTAQRQIPDEWRDQWATELAQKPRARDDRQAQTRWLIFRVGDERCALPASSVVSTHTPGPRHTLPGRQESLVPQIVQLEGRVLLLADTARCLGLSPKPGTGFPRTLVLDAPPSVYALDVDEITDILDLDQGSIQAAPVHLRGAMANLLAGVWHDEHGEVTMLDPGRLAERLDADLA